jgi:IMP dehydrogenase
MIHIREALTFDDVCLVPRYNNIPSRTETDLRTWLTTDMRIDIPILASNMDTVISPELAAVLHKNGSVPIFHRWLKLEEKKELFNRYANAFFSIGLEDKENTFQLINGLGVKNLIIDVAHGHDKRVCDLIKRLMDEHSDLQIIAGNVCSPEGYIDLVMAGAKAVKVGIGCGAACTTRLVTGVGVPQFSALLEINEVAKRLKVPFIADGGIRKSGDVVKCLAAGAASVMLGRAFADTRESAAVGIYRGQASEQFQVERMAGLKKGTVPEGIAIEVFQDRPAQELIDMLLGGIRSGLTYGGARNIEELQEKAEWRRVTSNYIPESEGRG